jgi:hypothetical protein
MVERRAKGADMRRATTLFLVVLFSGISPGGVQACGDKLLLASRDFPFFRPYAAIHPASVLIYVPKAAKSPGAGGGLASVLRRAGHDAQVVGDPPRLATTLQSGQVDIVLANIVDMPDVETASVGCPSHPVLLPVLFDPSAATLAAARTHYGLAMKAPETANRFLATIDEAMGSRPSHAPKKQKH